MGEFHDRWRPIGANRDGREIERSEAGARLLEAIEVPGVAAEVEAAARADDGPGRPQTTVPVPWRALREVLGGNADEAEAAIVFRLPPVLLLDSRDAVVGEPLGETERHQEERSGRRSQLRDRRQIEMIVVIVRDDHNVDARKIAEGHSRRPEAARPRPRSRARP